MEGRLRNRVNRIRAGGIPDTSPTDPVDMQQHLAALALAELTGVRDTDTSHDTSDNGNGNGNGNETVADSPDRRPSGGASGGSGGVDSHGGSESGGSRNGESGGRRGGESEGWAAAGSSQSRPSGSGSSDRSASGSGGVPDVTVIIDERTLREGHPREGSVCDIGLGKFRLPIETIRGWACIGTITPVVVSADGTRLLLGRETRLANAVQRRALRVLYRSCALCETAFDLCQIHHVGWYSLGGFTDIGKLRRP